MSLEDINTLNNCFGRILNLKKYISILDYESKCRTRIDDVKKYLEIKKQYEEVIKNYKSGDKAKLDSLLDRVTNVLSFNEDSISDTNYKNKIANYKNELQELKPQIIEGIKRIDDATIESTYEKAINEMETSSIYSLNSAYENFISIIEYKDSKAKAEECKNKIAKLNADIAKGKKIKKIKIAISIFTIVAVIAGVVLYKTVLIYEIRFNKAIAMRSEGKFDEAISEFENLAEHKKEASNEINETTYQKALFMSSNGEYNEAISLLTSISSYSDSQQKISDIKNQRDEEIYQHGVSLLSEGKYTEAKEIFNSIDYYSDSKQQIDKCIEGEKQISYDQAITFINQEKFDEAEIVIDYGHV